MRGNKREKAGKGGESQRERRAEKQGEEVWVFGRKALSLHIEPTTTQGGRKMGNRYKTIAQAASGLYKEKGSKFLSFAEPVETEEEIKERIAAYRKTYHDARHVCYAWMLGSDRTRFRQNDDGEPSGTAGRPILGQINSRELTNVLTVVVRYFGGILLGTSGLITAYREAAADALDKAGTEERDVTVRRTVRFAYEEMNRVMRILKETEAVIVRQDYEAPYCVIEFDIKQEYEGRI